MLLIGIIITEEGYNLQQIRSRPVQEFYPDPDRTPRLNTGPGTGPGTGSEPDFSAIKSTDNMIINQVNQLLAANSFIGIYN